MSKPENHRVVFKRTVNSGILTENLPEGALSLQKLIIDIDKDELIALLNEVDTEEYAEKGATLFVNIYENPSKFDNGPETYFSTSAFVKATEPYEPGKEKASKVQGRKMEAAVDSAFKRKGGATTGGAQRRRAANRK